MKFILLIMTFIAISVTQIIAQQGRGFGPGEQQLIIQHADELGLTEEQKKEIIHITLEARQQYRGSMRGQRGSMRGTQTNGRRGEIQRGTSGRFERGIGYRSSLNAEVLEVLTEEQRDRLYNLMAERAESAHEFRTLSHQLMVSNAGIEGEKAARALEILNRRSELRLGLAKERITSPDTVDREARLEVMAETRQLSDELRNLLTVAEYQQLTGTRGLQRSEARGQERRPRRGNR